ncbi:MAG: MarR family transcriptional regulator [Mycobacteriaceae bacterium]|nr:MarR family transcriptional regulator [Mycobacteriaceae bacterium]
MQSPERHDDTVVNRIGDNLATLQRLREKTFSQLMALTDGQLDPPTFVCLSRLVALGPLSSGALAKETGADPSRVSRQVASLVERGLVRREADPHDGRISLLGVTDAGRALAAHAREQRNTRLAHVMADWTDAERDLFGDLLDRFVAGYRTHKEDFIASLRATYRAP